MESRPSRRTQADRRAHTRNALLEAAARGLSRYGYNNLGLERVAADAGYTRGALYHLFANKEELALAVVEWVVRTWGEDVGSLGDGADPLDALIAVARGHVAYCRRDVARVMMTLHIEFAGQDHPVGRAVTAVADRFVATTAERIEAARAGGELPPGPPPRETALAYLGAVHGLGIHLAGAAPHDVELAERAVRGVLGLPPVAGGETGQAEPLPRKEVR
ncbi:TetR/AcrR family transcriptional regulator [Saccharopolyspora erythraea]|uniref:TetR/AcrR family transcriptional regulator n=1 Tax=Saccharopolyspora erythraea TaxID=1836 RepID=UPI001BA7DB61|nr:TetR/AcrR family transcriptional regulator [Saccharopolyspora erythraea]QUH04600.1 TetR/AcrR family transcriptional regulator [Saccharopolyspora erythraea]